MVSLLPHNGSSVQFLGNPIAEMSMFGYCFNRSIISEDKLVLVQSPFNK